MTKRLKSIKLWYVFTVISAVIIFAGIALFVLMGFNTAAENSDYKTFEVRYSVNAVLKEKEEEIQKVCEDAFKTKNLKFDEKKVYDEIAGSGGAATGSKRLVYVFSKSADDAALAEAKTVAESGLTFEGVDYEKTVAVNTIVGQAFSEECWRGAVAIAVGAVVVLIYTGVRFGVGCALSGLVGVVNSVFFTLGLFVVARIPVFAFGPFLYAAIAAICTLLLWLLHCIKMKDNFKAPEFKKYSSDEALAQSLLSSDKFVLLTAYAFFAVVLVVGLVATPSVMALALPAIVSVWVSVYSVMLFAPAVHLHIKRKFDAIKEARINKYAYKKKAKAEKEAGESKPQE